MDLNKLRKDITEIIDDVKYHSDSLTDLERLPVIQLKILLAKINKLHERTAILLHYVEEKGSLSGQHPKTPAAPVQVKPVQEVIEKIPEQKVEPKVPEESIPSELEEAPAPAGEPSKKSAHQIDLEEKLKRNLSNDLMSAIGINEKYLFASKLFKGDLEQFKSSIEEFNRKESLTATNQLIESMALSQSWDLEDATTIDFILLVQRRFETD